ncbi:MAG: hypothetical protein AAF984_09925 [Verrucomicrobiota bacterium]
MPFPASVIEKRIAEAQAEDRLAHAYLLSGPDLEELEALFEQIAARLLNISTAFLNPAASLSHPDLHIIRPESKSRRIRIDQIRQLEHALQLHAHDAPVKVAGIIAADRMCMPPAEAANAFLKTLEEPPANSVIFLITDHPSGLLPTIFSRCLSLSLKGNPKKTPSIAWDKDWLAHWLEPASRNADTAYKMAAELSSRWSTMRDEIQARLKKAAKADAADPSAPLESENVLIAQAESEFLLARDLSLADLISGIWECAQSRGDLYQAIPICENLEELRAALNRNIDADLALERTCLTVFGHINSFKDKVVSR